MSVLEADCVQILHEETARFLRLQRGAKTHPISRLRVPHKRKTENVYLLGGDFAISTNGKHYWSMDERDQWQRYRANTLDENEAKLFLTLII